MTRDVATAAGLVRSLLYGEGHATAQQKPDNDKHEEPVFTLDCRSSVT
jgi:hypothetical protein